MNGRAQEIRKVFESKLKCEGTFSPTTVYRVKTRSCRERRIYFREEQEKFMEENCQNLNTTAVQVIGVHEIQSPVQIHPKRLPLHQAKPKLQAQVVTFLCLSNRNIARK